MEQSLFQMASFIKSQVVALKGKKGLIKHPALIKKEFNVQILYQDISHRDLQCRQET